MSTKLTKRQRRLHRKLSPHDVEIFAGPDDRPSAHMQEFGTGHHDPQPYMRPAWAAEKMDVFTGIASDLWHEIKKSAYRVNSRMAPQAPGISRTALADGVVWSLSPATRFPQCRLASLK